MHHFDALKLDDAIVIIRNNVEGDLSRSRRVEHDLPMTPGAVQKEGPHCLDLTITSLSAESRASAWIQKQSPAC